MKSAPQKTAGKKILSSALAAAVFFYAGLAPAEDKDKKTQAAKYWVSVATQNLLIPGMPQDALSAGLFGGKMTGGPSRSLILQLSSPQPEPADPLAAHDIPPGQRMGDTLPLVIPFVSGKERGEYKEGAEHFEKPRLRMLIYWGCSEDVKPGQPRVIDTEKLSPVEFGKALSGRSPSPQYPPALRTGWVYSEWPNEKSRFPVPEGSSLKGEHFVHGNYSPDIRFTIGERQDFMSPVEFTAIKGGLSDSIKFRWRSIPNAVGYFATAIAHNEKNGDMIIWTSSEVPEPGYGLMDYLPSADVRRFIKEKAVMPPGITGCNIPKGIFRESEGAMLQFIAYGEELNLAYPPKPKDPKKAWDPLWTVKVRLKSTGMAPIGNSLHSSESPALDGNGEQSGKSREPDERQPDDKQKDKEGSGSPLNVIKGLFGF